MKNKILLAFLIVIAALVALIVWKSNQGVQTVNRNTVNSVSTGNTVSNVVVSNTVKNEGVKNTVTAPQNQESTKVNDEVALKKAIANTLNVIIAGLEPTKGTFAEGHKILGTKTEGNTTEVYLYAEYGMYNLVNGKIEAGTACSEPVLMVFKTSNGEYNLERYRVPSIDGDEEWEKSLKEMFPENLIVEAKSQDTSTNFYQEQIKAYLTNTK